jgi:hypothetical protein
MVIGLLVLYYKKYAQKAIYEFEKLIYSISNEVKIIIIINSDILLDDKYEFIKGSNKCAEFSAWQEGLDYVKNKYGNNVNGVIFANDTFCYHREYKNIHSLVFKKIIKKTILEKIKPVISGEYCAYKKGIFVEGIEIKGWISTYLYAVNKVFLEKIMWCIVVDDNKLNKLFPGNERYDKFFGSDIDNSYKDLMMEWLFKGKKAWYKSEELDINNVNKFTLKAKCIYMEMVLSKKIDEYDVKINNINKSIIIIILKILNKIGLNKL